MLGLIVRALIAILFLAWIANVEVKFKPFSVKVNRPYMALAILFNGLSMYCFYNQGYRDNLVTKEDVIEAINSIANKKPSEI